MRDYEITSRTEPANWQRCVMRDAFFRKHMTVTVIIVLFQQTYLLRPSHYLRHIQPFEPHIRVTVARCIYQPSRFCHTDRPPVPLRSDLLPVVLSSSNLVLPQDPWHTDKRPEVTIALEWDNENRVAPSPGRFGIPTSPPGIFCQYVLPLGWMKEEEPSPHCKWGYLFTDGDINKCSKTSWMVNICI